MVTVSVASEADASSSATHGGTAGTSAVASNGGDAEASANADGCVAVTGRELCSPSTADAHSVSNGGDPTTGIGSSLSTSNATNGGTANANATDNFGNSQASAVADGAGSTARSDASLDRCADAR